MATINASFQMMSHCIPHQHVAPLIINQQYGVQGLFSSSILVNLAAGSLELTCAHSSDYASTFSKEGYDIAGHNFAQILLDLLSCCSFQS
jgi:hypothetical protein